MAKVSIKGTIVSDDDKWIYDWFGIRATCPADIHGAIEEAAGEELEIEINSGGGDVLAGNEIYTALRTYKGRVSISIVGIAASAASYIAAARRCTITPVGLYMIHNASGSARGDYHAMDQESEVLQTVNRAITAAYMEKTGMEQKELLKLMDQETWLTAEQAVEYGFVDSITESQEQAMQSGQAAGSANGNSLAAVYNGTQILGREIIEKARKVLLQSAAGTGRTAPEGDIPEPSGSVLINQITKKAEVEEMADTQEDIQTIEELTAKYPELARQIRASAAAEAASAENGRLKAIDEIAGQISDEMVQEAKYGEKKMTAPDLALEAFRQNGIMARTALNAMRQDIQESNTEKVRADANTGYADGPAEDEAARQAKVKNLAEKLKRNK